MDSLITAAALALAAGDPLGALNRVALRDDAPALALRGTAMAQLGDLARARTLLRRAVRAFAPAEAVARARCIVAEAEIALVSRDLTWSAKALATARATLEARGDKMNAVYARHLEIRHLLLTGRLDAAEQLVAAFDPKPVPPAVRAAHELVVAGIAMRRVRTKIARAFRGKEADESHRARLRVEIGRLRRVLRPLAGVIATDHGFALVPQHAREVVMLGRPREEQHAAVLAFLADGESWSTSALALALGSSQRTVQRALEKLGTAGKVQSFGRGRARRWMAPPVPGFTTTLLLPAPLPSG